MLLRTVTATILVTLLAATAWAGYPQTKPPRSFRGLAWATPVEKIEGLLPVTGPGFKDTYYREDEPTTFGEAEIVSVAYYFRKGKLYRVGVAFKGQANQFLIKERLVMKYGPGRQVGHRYGWMWPNFSVEVNYDSKTGTGGLYYTFEGKLD